MKIKQIWHPYTDWECYHAGMYDAKIEMSNDEAKQAYCTFLQDLDRFKRAMARVVAEWPKSCEHFLTNVSVNRIAWLGQASMCIETGIPCHYRAGFNLMTNEEREAANRAALHVLTQWLRDHAKRNRKIRQDVGEAWLFDRAA